MSTTYALTATDVHRIVTAVSMADLLTPPGEFAMINSLLQRHHALRDGAPVESEEI